MTENEYGIADWCPCGEYAPVICRHYEKREDAHADR